MIQMLEVGKAIVLEEGDNTIAIVPSSDIARIVDVVNSAFQITERRVGEKTPGARLDAAANEGYQKAMATRIVVKVAEDMQTVCRLDHLAEHHRIVLEELRNAREEANRRPAFSRCFYCYHRISRDLSKEARMAEMDAHIRSCPSHPLYRAIGTNVAAQDSLLDLLADIHRGTMTDLGHEVTQRIQQVIVQLKK